MKRKIVIMAGALALAGCMSNGTNSQAPVSKAKIAAVEVSTTTAINLANRCLSLNIGPCGVAASRLQIIAAEHEANSAFLRLQQASADGQAAALALANEALRQLAVLTPPVPAAK